jgi:hypothetical protein
MRSAGSETIKGNNNVDYTVDASDVEKVYVMATPKGVANDMDVAGTFTVRLKETENMDGCVFEHLLGRARDALLESGYTSVDVTCTNVECDNNNINVCPSLMRRRRDENTEPIGILDASVTSTTTTTQPATGDSSGLDVGSIVGISVGSAVGVFVIVYAVYSCPKTASEGVLSDVD